MVQVSLSASAGSNNLNRLIETEGAVANLNFSLDELPPASGLTVEINSPNLSEFDVNQTQITGGEFNLSEAVETQLEVVLLSRLSAVVPGGAIATTSPLGNFMGAAGLANLESEMPVNPDDRFEVGSVTKTFTATTLLKLVEAGTLTLDDRLTDWLPDSVTDNVPNASDISLRQLLNHTSGVPEYDFILLEEGMTNPFVFLQDWQPSGIVELIADSEPFFAPGEGWQYANTNFILAGMVIEAATGNSLADEIQAKIIDPLGLENTFFSTTKDTVPGGYISGYLDFDNNETLDDVSIANLSWTWAAGAIVSNPEDLTEYARALYTGDLLSDAAQAEMFTLVDTGRGYEYGLGMMSFDTPELGRVVGHRGGSLGFNANMWYAPEDDFTYVELLNGRTEEALVTDTIPAFSAGPIVDIGNVSDYSQFDITLTNQTAQVLLPVANDGLAEGEETVSFALEPSADYTLDPNAQTSTLTIIDTVDSSLPTPETPTNTMQVSLSTSTTFDGDLNALVETQGTAITFRFDLDEPAPAGGLTVFVDGDVEQILNRLDGPAFLFNPVAENLDFSEDIVIPNRDSSGFVVTIAEGATFGTATLNIFNNPEPDTLLPATFDGLVEATFSLVTEEQVDRDVEGPIPTLSDYTVDAAAATSVVLFADDATQLPGTLPPSTPGTPQVSLFVGPNYLIEDEGTVSAHAFNVTGSIIPEGGLVVSVDAPNLSEFDLAGLSVEGGEIVAAREGGFDLRMTEYTTLVNLPIADDGETEPMETASFSLAAGEGYEIIADYSGGSFGLVDTRLDIPRGIINEPNNDIANATETQISPENPTFFGTDSVYFDIGNRYLNEDGTYTYIDYSEDVDVYKVDLMAGDTITIETFDFDTNVDEFGVGFAINAFVYDAEGNQLQDYINTGFDPAAAPDKLFGGIGPFDPNETDSYDEFTAPADGSYFIAVGDDGQVQNFWDEAAPFYDPNVPGSGQGNRSIFGDYSIEINLLTEDNPRRTGTPTPPVSNPGVTNPPTLSLSANPTTTDGDGNFINAVVEHVDVGGVSSVTFTIQADGEIPEGGLEFVLNSDTNLFDYVSYLGQSALPSTIGGQSLGAFYNADGIPTGIRLLIDEPLMTVTYESANNQLWFPTFYGNIVGRYEPLETDGPETVNFFLQPGEGYVVSAEAGSTDVTYYDSVADVPPPIAGGDAAPVVSITASESTLIETEQTETTITFNLSEEPLSGGLTIFVDSENETVVGSPLSQFAVLEAEVTGGNFPIPNGDSSGFFFNVTEQTASITLSVFDELTVPNIDPLAVQEGIVALDFALQPLAGYTIDPDASEINFTIADNPDSGIQVSLTGEPEALIESEGTVSVHTFSLSTLPPAEGLTVSVAASALSEFDLAAIEVVGGTIAAVRDDGFDFTITEQTATISLPVLDDGVVEGSETATFTLAASDDYELNAAFNEATFTLADTLDQATVAEESELIGDEISNSTIPEANALSLSIDTD